MSIRSPQSLVDNQPLRLQVIDICDGSFLSSDSSSILLVHGLIDSPVNRSPNSLVLIVEDFRPYLYFPIGATFTAAHLHEFQDSLRRELLPISFDFKVELVSAERQPLRYHRVNRQTYAHFLRIECKNNATLTKIDSVLQSAKERAAFRQMYAGGQLYDDMVYESNVALPLRFMVDTQLAGGAWITLPAGSWQRLNDESICSRFHSRGLSQSVNYTLRLRSFRDIQSHSNSAHVRLADADRYKFERMPMSLADMSNSRFRVMAVDVCRLMKRHETSYSAASAPTKKKRKPTSQSATATAMVAVEYKLVAISSVLYEGSDVVGGRHTLACRKFFDEEEEDEGVQLFDTEIEVVERWLQLMRSFDPDILEGYELSTHWSWLCTKLASISRYPLDLGRIYNDAHSSAGSSSIKRTKLPRTRQRVASKLLRQGGGRQSADSAIADAIDSGTDSNGGGDSLSRPRISAPSNRAFQVVECIGRILLDIRQVMEHEELMSTYGFGEIVRRFLHRETEILDDENLERLLAGQMVDIDGGHQRAVQYWQTRCERVFAVVEESKVLLSLIELARITGINISDVMLRGQMVRFQSQLLQFCRKASYLLPSPTRQTVAGMSEGALNLMPEIGYHTKYPVAVLDFKSLYPSVIIANNMCFSTELLHDEDIQMFGKESSGQHIKSLSYSSKDLDKLKLHFVQPSVKSGIIPEILRYLIDERRHLRTQLATTHDPAQRLVLDTRQKAVKICANSVYGALGSPKSFLPFLNLANAVVLTGAQMLQTLVERIPRQFFIGATNGSLVIVDEDCGGDTKHNEKSLQPIKVIYGDTDSVFIAFPGLSSVEQSIDCAKRICQHLNQSFPVPICLDFEQVLFPSLFLQRKRYAGLSWKSKPSTESPEIISRGIETNRRDSCPIVAETMEQTLQLMLWPNRDDAVTGHQVPLFNDYTLRMIKQRIVQHLTDVVDRITADQIDMGAFIMTKGLWLGTEEQDYRTKQAHVELAQKIKQRQERQLSEGERISYVFVKGTGTAARMAYEKVETVDYAIINNLPLDYAHYIEHQLHRPLGRVVSELLSEQEINSIFTVRKTSAVVTPSSVKGTITKYFPVVQTKCFGCKTKIGPGKILCSDCEVKHDEILHQRKAERQQLADERNQLHAICHRCQGSERNAILCTNHDCRIYFRRLKNAAKLLQHTQTYTHNFDW